jgi:hypothetical protein
VGEMQTLAQILREDVWRSLRKPSKLIVKILQHIHSKVNGGSEVRAYFDDDEILVTTSRSEIRVTPRMLEFKRRTENSLRVQRVKLVHGLSQDLLNLIKGEIVAVLEHGHEPNYALIIGALENRSG